MKIAIGNDHAGTEVKKLIKQWLTKEGHKVIDLGTGDLIRTHFPIYGRKVALNVIKKRAEFGIVICGTGIGIGNSASKVKGAKVSVADSIMSAKIAREYFNANILALGARVTAFHLMKEIISAFLDAEYNRNEDSEEFLRKVHGLIPKLKDKREIFSDQLEKWYKGYYTRGVKQDRIKYGE